MSLGRILRHLASSPWRARRTFPPATLDAIERAIRDTEAEHDGQIRVAVEHALDLRRLWAGASARERAIEVFGELRVWDTERNNGVLIYLLLADRDVEIVADRGIHAHVGAGWEPICRAMEERFRRGEFEAGIIAGIGAVGAHLQRHFGGGPRPPNELPDRPLVR